MSVEVLYKTSATAHGGGRDGGQTRTDDGALDLKFATPKEMGGNGNGNNPEQLFAVGYATCFLGAMRFVASQNKDGPQVPQDATVQSFVGFGKRSEGGFGLDVELKVSLPGLPREQAQALVDNADKVCPYSNALRGGVPVRLSVA